jgi:hypothetical protein
MYNSNSQPPGGYMYPKVTYQMAIKIFRSAFNIKVQINNTWSYLEAYNFANPYFDINST